MGLNVDRRISYFYKVCKKRKNGKLSTNDKYFPGKPAPHPFGQAQLIILAGFGKEIGILPFQTLPVTLISPYL
jgi:hypothetical protein